LPMTSFFIGCSSKTKVFQMPSTITQARYPTENTNEYSYPTHHYVESLVTSLFLASAILVLDMSHIKRVTRLDNTYLQFQIRKDLPRFKQCPLSLIAI
jgi:hypothetical protein